MLFTMQMSLEQARLVAEIIGRGAQSPMEGDEHTEASARRFLGMEPLDESDDSTNDLIYDPWLELTEQVEMYEEMCERA